ncbi:MAG: hypothetical protein FH749_13850 [Firmicutes bacterium]|nr:hypothetical protein [Bacillota bacterium]
MVRNVCYMLVLLLLFTGAGCNGKVSDVTLDEEEIYTALKEWYKHSEDISVLATTQLQEHLVIVVSYNYNNARYTDYCFIHENDGKAVIRGSSGGLAESDLEAPRPLTFSSGGAIGDDGSYLITYGEIVDETIEEIRLEYSDGVKISEKVSGNGYLIIREEAVAGVKVIEALDGAGEVVYRVP